jgi:transposase-like protein
MNLITLFKKFPNENSCIAYLEKIRWGNGVKCVYCGGSKISTHITKTREDRSAKRWQCSSCLKSFSVTTNTIFHRTHLDLRYWFYIITLMLNAKKGLSAYQVSRDLEIRRMTAWSCMHKIRVAMGTEQKELLQGIFQMDETYVKTKKDKKKDDDNDDEGSFGGGKRPNNIPVVAVVDNKGNVKASEMKSLNAFGLFKFAKRIAKEGSTFHTDMNASYKSFKPYYNVESVKHAVEYVSNKGVHCNAVESFWSLLKRGIKGNYHFVSKKYLQNYINEFEFRYNVCEKEDLGFNEIVDRLLKNV